MLALLVFGAWKIHTTVSMQCTFTPPVEERMEGFWTDAWTPSRTGGGPRTTPHSSSGTTCERAAVTLRAMKSPKGETFWSTGIYKGRPE